MFASNGASRLQNYNEARIGIIPAFSADISATICCLHIDGKLLVAKIYRCSLLGDRDLYLWEISKTKIMVRTAQHASSYLYQPADWPTEFAICMLSSSVHVGQVHSLMWKVTSQWYGFVTTGCSNKKDHITKIAIAPMFLGEFLYFLHQWKQTWILCKGVTTYTTSP